MKTSLLICVIFFQSLYAVFSIPLDTKSIDLDKRECKDKRDDCRWITDNHYDVTKYCWAHRHDAFIKDCPRFCGFCKQPAPPVPVPECKDKRDDCHWITDNHYNVAKYCWAHRHDAFIKDCPRFCGFCSRQPAPPHVVCEDTRNDCSWIAEHNNDVAAYCDRHRNDAFIKQCLRTCGYCKAPAPTVVCEDTRSGCDWINKKVKDKEAYCHQYRNDPEVRKCARTCGFCKVPAPPLVVACIDTRNDCSWIGKHYDDIAAYCDRHRNDAFIKQCPRTCGYCKAPAPARICEDTRSDCDTINHIGEPKASYCHRLRNDPNVRQCAKTCGFC